jgi:hypothetical protein
LRPLPRRLPSEERTVYVSFNLKSQPEREKGLDALRQRSGDPRKIDAESVELRSREYGRIVVRIDSLVAAAMS